MKDMNSMKSEFNLKYSGTVMMVEHEDVKCLGKVDVSEDGWPFIHVNGYYKNGKKEGKVIIGSFTIDSLLLTRWLPQEGYYNKVGIDNEDYTTFFLKRSNSKHWSNSYSTSSYTVATMPTIAKALKKMTTGVLSSSVVSSIYNPTYLPLQQAYDVISTSGYIAITAKVCLELIGDKVIALYAGYPFGICVKNRKGDVSVRLTDKSSAIKELFVNQGIPCYYERVAE